MQNFRATIIPLLTVPVSLIGTFIFFPALGFSLNTLSMFGLVLAIGIVVDDAIVVVEAVMHHIEHGMTPKDATIQAMKEVSAPVIGIALILSAVFIPVAFLGGLTGRMYQQFALTIAISVLLSAFNALSLSPALCAMFLRAPKPGRGLLGKFFGGFNRGFDRVTRVMSVEAGSWCAARMLTIVIVAAVAVGAGLFGSALPSGFVPEEDQGVFSVSTFSFPPDRPSSAPVESCQSRGDPGQDRGSRLLQHDRRLRNPDELLSAELWLILRAAQAVGRTPHRSTACPWGDGHCAAPT